MEQIFNLLKDKKAALKYILDAIEESNHHHAIASKMIHSVTREDNPNFSAENLLKINLTVLKITHKQADFIKNLAIIALVHASSSNFDVEIAHLMNKLGRGEEALKQMFENKLNGR